MAQHTAKKVRETTVVQMPGVEMRLSAEHALRAAIDTQIFATLRDLETLEGGRAVQAVYVALMRRLPNVVPDRRRLAIDAGVSETSVKRAISLLEECRLIEVKRRSGFSSVYHLADIRLPEVASMCLASIKKLARSESKKEGQGRATCEPTSKATRATCGPTSEITRVTSDPTPRVTSEPRVGPQVAHKETNKIQTSKQVVVVEKASDRLDEVLARWKLTSASYLTRTGDARAIPLLTDCKVKAARLIDMTMKRGSWTERSGVGSRVNFLRDNVESADAALRESERVAKSRSGEMRKRAQELATRLGQGQKMKDPVFSPERDDAFLKRALKGLNEPDGVVEHLKGDRDAIRQLVAEEVLWESVTEEISRMTDGEFVASCEKLFESEPGLRKLFSSPKRESVSLRLKLAQFLKSKKTAEIDEGLSACSRRESPEEEMGEEPHQHSHHRFCRDKEPHVN